MAESERLRSIQCSELRALGTKRLPRKTCVAMSNACLAFVCSLRALCERTSLSDSTVTMRDLRVALKQHLPELSEVVDADLLRISVAPEEAGGLKAAGAQRAVQKAVAKKDRDGKKKSAAEAKKASFVERSAESQLARLERLNRMLGDGAAAGEVPEGVEEFVPEGAAEGVPDADQIAADDEGAESDDAARPADQCAAEEADADERGAEDGDELSTSEVASPPTSADWAVLCSTLLLQQGQPSV